MAAPPSLLILPPDVADVEFMAEAAVVVRVAITGAGGAGEFVLVFLQEANNNINRKGNSIFFMYANSFVAATACYKFKSFSI